MALQQLSFGGVSRISYCSRCKKALSNPASVEAGMGPVCRGHGGKDMDECKRTEFADGQLKEMVPLSEALVLQRAGESGDADIDRCAMTNVPHLVVHHSPNGFDWGYGGSAAADLALNVCQWYLNSIGYEGQKTWCFDGTCWSLAYILHQEFKRSFIESAPYEGCLIPAERIQSWFEEHITDDLKGMYSVVEEE